MISKPSVNSNWSYRPETPNSGQSQPFLSPVTLKFDGWPWKTIGHLFYIALRFQSHRWIQTGITVRKRSIRLKIGDFLGVVWPWNLTDAFKNNRAPLLGCCKLCASFHSHQRIQTRVTVRKHPIWVKIDDFVSRLTLKFDGWLWKTIGHLFSVTSSFVHHFTIREFKLELQSGNG